MRMITILFVGVLLLACGDDDGSGPGSSCAPGELLSGAVLPDAEGWATVTNLAGAPDVTTDGATVRVDSLTDSASNPVVLLTQDTGLEQGDAFSLQWELAVNDADPHNSFDSGAAVLPSYEGTAFFGTPDERAQMIYFDTDEIGWADESQAFALDTTMWHTYRLDVEANGDATLSVDGTARLSRMDLVVSGPIAFGDQTNDANVDGDFQISDIELICP